MIAVAMACAAVAAWCAVPPDAAQRLRRVLGVPRPPRPRLDHLTTRQVIALAVAVAVLIVLVTGGVLGFLAGGAAAIGIVLTTHRHAHRDGRDADLALVRQAPITTELLCAVVGAGASIVDAVGAAASAVPDPASSHLGAVRAAALLGASPEEAWSRVPRPLAPIGIAIRRSQESGAPLTYVLEMTAEDLRREHRSAIQAAARAAGVRVVAPLALCFLPAYLLIGVVPIVASLARGLLP